MDLKRRDFTLASIDYNAFMGSNKNSATLLGALVIRDLGQKEKADQTMHGWVKGNEKDKIAQWAMAAYSSNFSEAQKLAVDMKITEDGTPWNPSRQDFSFELVEEIYLLLNR